MNIKNLDPVITQLVERFGMTRNHACQWKLHCSKEGRDLWSYGQRKHKKKRKRVDPETLLTYPGPTVLQRTGNGWVIPAAGIVEKYVCGG